MRLWLLLLHCDPSKTHVDVYRGSKVVNERSEISARILVAAALGKLPE